MAKNQEEIDVDKTAKRSRGSGKVITSSSTAEYFSKNLQQVGFSSPTKAVLTTLKEALDNALDACEEHQILPEIWIDVQKIGAGSLRNTDRVRVVVKDNGPGIEAGDIAKVFGEYLASSKFGRGRCSRGQQGIGISAATTWSLQTAARGAQVITKMANAKKATGCLVTMDLKNNKGVLKEKTVIDWDLKHGTSVEFLFDGRIQLNGEAGILAYLSGNILVNPHMTLHYNLPDSTKDEYITVERVTDVCPVIPEAISPHPHTMKLGELIAHAKMFGSVKTQSWLKKGFSRISDRVIDDILSKAKLPKSFANKTLGTLSSQDFQKLYTGIQQADLLPPSTTSVIAIGEEGLAKSIKRLGEVDFFSTVSRKPTICDLKPVQVEVAIARFLGKRVDSEDEQAQVLRFANRVPLQFDKASCAIVKAINTVNWRNYGLKQSRAAIPSGPYIISVSLVSPFIKFKNASKETVDASDELVEEIRRALMQAGQRLSRHIKRETKENELEQRLRHIEKFGPILVETLVRITGSSQARKKRAEDGLVKILGRDAKTTQKELAEAEDKLTEAKAARKKRLGLDEEHDEEPDEEQPLTEGELPPTLAKATKKVASGLIDKAAKKKKTAKQGKKARKQSK